MGDALLFGMKRCPPCTHLERLTGMRLVKPLAPRGGINAAVFSRGTVAQGDVVGGAEQHAGSALVDEGVGAQRLRVLGGDVLPRAGRVRQQPHRERRFRASACNSLLTQD